MLRREFLRRAAAPPLVGAVVGATATAKAAAVPAAPIGIVGPTFTDCSWNFSNHPSVSWEQEATATPLADFRAARDLMRAHSFPL